MRYPFAPDQLIAYKFESESGEEKLLFAYTLDGAFNIAHRYFRHEPFWLVGNPSNRTQ